MKTVIWCLLVGAFLATTNGRVIQKTIPLDQDIFKGIFDLTKSLRDNRIFNATVNGYADKILANMDQLFIEEDMDPYSIGDIYKGYWWGNLKVTKIKVIGLSSLSRTEDAVMTYNHFNKQLQLDLPITIKELKFTCHFKASLIGIGPSGDITGDVSNVLMTTSLVLDYNLDQAFIRLFEIPDSGHISIHIHSSIFSDWIYNLLSDAITAIFHESILDTIAGEVQIKLKKIMDVIDQILKAILG